MGTFVRLVKLKQPVAEFSCLLSKSDVSPSQFPVKGVRGRGEFYPLHPIPAVEVGTPLKREVNSICPEKNRLPQNTVKRDGIWSGGV